MRRFDHVTIMFSLPRSMTQWWAWYFAQSGEVATMHDPLSRCGRPETLLRDIPDGAPVLVVDTSAVFFHERLRKAMPGAKRMYNFRHPADVKTSLERETGSRQDARINAAYEALYRHAYDEDNLCRQHYGAFDLEAAARVVGTAFVDRTLLQTKVDVPVRKQFRDPKLVRSLMSYSEI